jgi:hypothetical protein
MANNEATARIKINKLLEAAGWRFFEEGGQPANIGWTVPKREICTLRKFQKVETLNYQ